MGCLFGYYGRKHEFLLGHMASMLRGRSPCGWEQVEINHHENQALEIGRGIPNWTEKTQLSKDSLKKLAAGYSGLIIAPLVEEPALFLRKITASESDFKKNLAELDGPCVIAAFIDGKLHLYRDPAGGKVLYWTKNRDRFLFASETKGLLADPATSNKIRIGAITEYLTFSYIPGENTMLEGIYELQPGHHLVFDGDNVDIQLVNDPVSEEEKFNGYTEEQLTHKMRSELDQSIDRFLNAVDKPPAVFLSGGIDSSAVMALAAKKQAAPIHSFSVHFGDDIPNENEFIQQMVDYCNSKHTWLEIRPDGFLDRLKDIIWILDEPIGDPITVPNYLLSEAASSVSPLVWNGEGGDPCFGGPKNIPMLLGLVYGPHPSHHEDWLADYYLKSYRKCYTDLDRMLDPDAFAESGGREALRQVVQPCLSSAPPKRFINRLMNINIRFKGANLIMIKVDKMTAAHGILPLSPLFTGRMIAFSMQCPPIYKLHGNIEKYILKQAVRNEVPHSIIDRPKSGMMVPTRLWFNREMQSYIRDTLSSSNVRQMGLFNIEYIEHLINDAAHDNFTRRYGTKLWMLLTFFLWYEHAKDGYDKSTEVAASAP